VLVIMRVVLALLGLALAVAVPARLGFAEVAEAVRPAMRVLPLCVLCELGRVFCEACATRLALGRPVKWGPMTLAHLGAYAAITVLPAPRPAAEAVKTSVLGDHVGVPEAASAGATIQAAVFFSVATMCGLAALMTRGTNVSWVLAGNCTLLIVLGIALRAMMRSERVARFLTKRWPKREATIARLHAVARMGHILAIGPTVCLVVSLFIRVLEQYFITVSMGGSPTFSGAVAAEGVRLLGASIGVLVPGQMGVREAVFAFSADALGTSAAHATAVALFTHVVELSLALVGFIALLVFSSRSRAKTDAAPVKTEPDAAPEATDR
jgi:uncharacterized membrane protein YbhN (UPF0104 family)